MEISSVQLQMEMASMAARAASQPAHISISNQAVNASHSPSFSDLLANAIDGVNAEMNASSALKKGLLAGQPGITLADVTLQSQKADVAFTSMTEIRNKLFDSYQKLLNM